MRLLIATSFPREPLRPHGGVEAVSVNLVRALASREDLEVHVVTSDRGSAQGEVSRQLGATIHRLPAGKQKLLTYVRGEGRRQLKACLEAIQPDLVHAHDFYGIMVQGLSVPRVFTVHGFIHEDTRYAGGRFAWLRSKLWSRVEVGAWAEQPHIISISPYVRERLRGIARGVIHDIENPIHAQSFDVCPRPGAGAVVIFSAALICKRKNTLGLVKVVEALVREGLDVRLRLAGSVSEVEYGRRLEEFVQQSGMRERVSMLGSLSAAQVREELAAASVFALLSFEEGAPMGVAEAMAAGLPVVTSNRCGMPYMVRDGESGFLVDPNNVEETAGRVRELMTNLELRRRMGVAAKEFALDRFHPERVAERTLAVYRQAAGLRRLAKQNAHVEE